jgi:hypothetical protein
MIYLIRSDGSYGVSLWKNTFPAAAISTNDEKLHLEITETSRLDFS